MDPFLEVLAALFLGAGCFFALTGAVGLLRMPDFYSRLHPAGKSDTLAQTLIMVGLAILVFGNESYTWMSAVKLALLTATLYVTAPVATHAITRVAHLSGLEPWKKEERSNG